MEEGSMYIARDSDGTLTAFVEEPQRKFYNNLPNQGWWYTEHDGMGVELNEEDDCYPELKWEDEPIKVLPMAVTDDYELKDWWMATQPATLHNVVRAFAKPVPAENFAYNKHKDEGLKVWHCTHE